MSRNRTAETVIIAIAPEELARTTTPVVLETATDFASRAAEALKPGTKAGLSRLGQATFLKRYGARLVKINATTRKQILKVLVQGVEQGKTTPELIRILHAKFAEISRGRAKTITRTEIGRASNYGLVEGFAAAGARGKRWLSTDDSHVREDHEELHGTVVALDAYFEVDGEQALYPGDFGVPELDINCRCILQPVWRLRTRAVGDPFTWRQVEAERLRFDRAYLRALRVAFSRQQAAATAALRKAA